MGVYQILIDFFDESYCLDSLYYPAIRFDVASVQQSIIATFCPCDILSLQRFVHATICPCDEFFATFCPQHFVCDIMSATICPATNCSATFCHATFCPQRFVRDHLSCNKLSCDILSCDILSATICPRPFVLRHSVLAPRPN
jgi:hypothetical protein